MKKFDGPLERLQELIAATGLPGDWHDIEHGHQFRAKSGAKLNWYPSTGTVSYGGPGTARTELLEPVAAVAGESPASTAQTTAIAAAPAVPTRIFVVHGHDETAREQLELVLHRLGLQPYVLANTGGSGLTIIEALEHSKPA